MFLPAIFVFIFLVIEISSSTEIKQMNECHDGFLWDFQQEICFPLCFHGPNTINDKLELEITNRTCASGKNIYFSTGNSTKQMLTQLPDCFNLTLNDSHIMNLTYDKRMEFSKAALATLHKDVVTTCYPISNFLNQCLQPLVLQSNETSLSPENLTLIDLSQGRHFTLGNYIILEDVAIVCNDTLPTQKKFCQPTTVSATEYNITTPHSGLYLPWRNETLPFAEYYTIGTSGSINLCYPLSATFRKCTKFEIPNTDITFLPNRSIYRSSLNTIIELGDYFNYSDTSVALCIPVPINDKPQRFDVYRIHGVLDILSAVCLLLSVVVHLAFPNRHLKPLIFYSISLAITYIALVWAMYYENRTKTYNIVIFAIVHYFSIAAFFWLNILAFDMWHKFSSLNNVIGSLSCMNCNTCSCERHKLHCYLVYGWLIPALITGSALALEFNPEAQKVLGMNVDIGNTVWIDDKMAIFVLYFGPLGIILLENLIMFLLTIWNLHEASRGTQLVNKRLNRQMLTVFAKLFVVMGMFWILELISWATGENRNIWQIPDLINASLGILIFIIFICKPSTLKAILGKIQLKPCLATTSTTKTTDVVLSSQSNMQFKPTLY